MIYILCPASLATGGTELLHQLGYKLRLFGFEATMLYYDLKTDQNPIAPTFEKYNMPFQLKQIDDLINNIVIIPEVAIPAIAKFKKVKRIIWWLSVDNAICSEEEWKIIYEDKSIINLCQSQYAMDYLKSKSIDNDRIIYLSDYINNEFFELENCEKENIVLFNPAKGFEYTLKLIMCSDARIKWQALRGLTPKEMQQTMSKAKVYIDFGKHPGKDRIPRETVINGCCIITNKQGAAANNIDIPINGKYKIQSLDTIEDVLNTLQLVYQILESYNYEIDNFKAYSEIIKEEEIEFEKNLLVIFDKLVGEYENDRTKIELLNTIVQCIDSQDFVNAFRYLTKYRIHGFEENVIFYILETNIRIAIGEYKEAEWSVKKGLEIEPENYELYLLLAMVYVFYDKNEKNISIFEESCEKALKFSKETNDSEIVKKECERLIQEYKSLKN